MINGHALCPPLSFVRACDPCRPGTAVQVERTGAVRSVARRADGRVAPPPRRLGVGEATRWYDAIVSSTNILSGVDPGSPVALHEQVAAAVRRAIADGEIGAGERMPPARDLAAVLGVNPNTVLRALRGLRDEGLLEFRRGRGITVTGLAPQRSAVIAKARELAAVARQHGYQPQEVAEILRLVSWEPL